MSVLRTLIVVVSMIIPNLAGASPNILLIIADDMGLDATPCYAVGKNPARMTNLQHLCAEGMVFENAYAAPTCSPTRAMIMTGKYGFETGVGGAITPENGRGLSSDETSLFDLMSEIGYESAVIGKWHLAGNNIDLNHPASLGVSDFFGPFSGAARDYHQWEAVENGKEILVSGYATTVLTDRAIRWIDGQSSPWFLWLAYNAPHAPFHLPPADLHSYGDLPADRRSIRRNPITYYNAALEALDTELGRLLGSIPGDVMDNTIVIFVGDNGTPNQIAGELYGPRGAKGGIYEGGTHVPLIVSGVGVQSGRSQALVGVVDLFATISSLAGARKMHTHSIDQSPVFAGLEGARAYVYIEHFSEEAPRGSGSLGWAVRDDRYKLVKVDGEAEMLFDIWSDPFEQKDLLSSTDGIEIKSRQSKLKSIAEGLRQ